MNERQARCPNKYQAAIIRRYFKADTGETLFSRIDVDEVFSMFAKAVQDRKEHFQGGLFP